MRDLVCGVLRVVNRERRRDRTRRAISEVIEDSNWSNESQREEEELKAWVR